MQFEWDGRKAAQNIAKHGVPFEYAARVFLDQHRRESEDTRRNYGETRWLSLGKIEDRLFVIAHTRRGEVIRLISARKANRREQRKYDEALSA
jgi:hypothetical protein